MRIDNDTDSYCFELKHQFLFVEYMLYSKTRAPSHKIGRLGARRKGPAASKPKSGYLLGHQLIARIMLLNGTEPIFYRIISVVLKLTGKYLGSVKKPNLKNNVRNGS